MRVPLLFRVGDKPCNNPPRVIGKFLIKCDASEGVNLTDNVSSKRLRSGLHEYDLSAVALLMLRDASHFSQFITTRRCFLPTILLFIYLRF